MSAKTKNIIGASILLGTTLYLVFRHYTAREMQKEIAIAAGSEVKP